MLHVFVHKHTTQYQFKVYTYQLHIILAGYIYLKRITVNILCNIINKTQKQNMHKNNKKQRKKPKKQQNITKNSKGFRKY